MSVDEMITSLEQQKRDCLHRYNAAIEHLKHLQDQPEPHGLEGRRKLSFDPIDIQGESLTQTVIDGRGPY